jgi:sterol desaturase/sphingolipid hydroxylase (fatty acid hydroxylase superfamily)
MNTSLLDPPVVAGPATTPSWPAPDPTARRHAPRTRRTVALTIAATLAALASIAIGNTAVGAIAVLFVISWPLERLWRRHPVGVRRLALRTDLAYAVASPALQFVGLVAAVALAAVSLAWLPGLALRPVVGLLPGWVRTTTGVLLFDLLVYWTHRWSHTIPLFWRFHAIHHSTRHLDWVSGFRAHPLDGAFIAPAFAFVLAAGFDPEITGALAVLQFVVGIWAHLNVRWRLRKLRFLVLTPDFHHWHHANEPAAINTNFSTLLPVWDLLFGTFRMPDGPGPQRYGVDEAVPSSIGAQLLYPFRRTGRRTRRWGVHADAATD